MKRLLISLLVLSTFTASGQTAAEIIRKVEDKMRGESSRSIMTMTIVRPDWKREITMKAWSLGRDYSLILITAPARDKGQAFLKRDNEMWNWQPSIDRVIKLPPSMMLQSWMGSDFTNDDLVRESSISEDYVHRLKADSVIDGKAVFQVELTPKPEAPVVWGKIIAFVDKELYNQVLVRYYDEDGVLVNTLVLSNVRPIGGKQLPTKMEMIPAENPDHRTVVEYLELAYDVGLTENFFSMQNMKRIR